MRSRAYVLWLVLAAAASFAAPSQAATGLACKSVHDDGSVTKVIHLDLVRKQACDQDRCHDLISGGADVLKYDCVAGPTFCEPTNSTAGPFITEEHFTFDTKTRAFRRKEVGNIGDMLSRPYSVDASGTCSEDAGNKP
jgi:hypothetical protein